MVKKLILLTSAVACLIGTAKAQLRCYSDEVNNAVRAKYPEEVAKNEAKLREAIDQEIARMNIRRMLKTTDASDTSTPILYVPIVFHVVHDYGNEYVSDNEIFETLKNINRMYNRQNADTADVITTYKYNIPGTQIKYIGKANIVFVLPSKDPQGNPTHGITRHQSYVTGNAGEGAKEDLWPRNNYLNIWIVRKFSTDHQDAAAYAFQPASAAMNPFGDGLITLYNYMNYDNTLSHEIGHWISLAHPFGNVNSGGNPTCGDDEVDDTPPTHGETPVGCVPSALYDTGCATGYMKTYGGINAHNLFGLPIDTIGGVIQPVTINYPDTVNAQNVMDYTYCSKMFTYLQTLRMRGALQSNVADRSNLISAANLAATGALDPWTDLPPVAEFSVEKGLGMPTLSANERTYFLCAGAAPFFYFKNRSWNDTVTSVIWEFSNNADSNHTYGLYNARNKFATPGWVDIKLTAFSNVNGSQVSTTVDVPHAVYAADPNGINANGYYQEFNAGGDLDKYPMFNYYNNPFKWELVNFAGYLDNTSIRFTGYDHRSAQNQSGYVGTPQGDFDDFFTPAFDLSGFVGGNCNLNFMTAGAFRTTSPAFMKDTLEVSYSTDCGGKWTLLKNLVKADIANNGTVNTEFAPGWTGQWKSQNLEIPAAARTSSTFFRFRYSTGTDNSTIGTGNNFYLDRLHISNNPLSVTTAEINSKGVVVAPNPTTGNAYVMISNADNGVATVQVTDITGKVIYSTSEKLSGNYSRIEIPASVIAVKGVYMVQVVTGSKSHTEKLVSY